jgi:hypothetical protein
VSLRHTGTGQLRPCSWLVTAVNSEQFRTPESGLQIICGFISGDSILLLTLNRRLLMEGTCDFSFLS